MTERQADKAESYFENLWLDVMNGNLLCSECKSKSPTVSENTEQSTDEFQSKTLLYPLDAPSLMAMRYCASAPIKRLFSFSIKNEDSAELFYRAAEGYMLNHLERGFQTLDFYYKIKD